MQFREIWVVLGVALSVSCTAEETGPGDADAVDEGTESTWTIEVLQTAWCDDAGACWRTFRVGGATASVEDREGVVALDATVDSVLRDRWSDFALSLEDGDCARGPVTDLSGQLAVTVHLPDYTLVIDDAWGCAGYGQDGGVDTRLAVLIEDTSDLAQRSLDCPPWDAYSAPFGPFEIVESTPRFVCYQ